MIFQQKNFGPNLFSKLFHPNGFRGNDFATIKKFRPKSLIKIMGNFALYYDFRLVFLKQTYIPVKTFSSNFFMKNSSRLLLSLRK